VALGMMPARIMGAEIMPKEQPETPRTQDLDEMARQMEAALVEARQTLENVPAQNSQSEDTARPTKSDADDQVQSQ